MADIKKEDVIEYIASMSVLELSELVKELEEKFGVSAAAPVAVAAAGAPAAGGEQGSGRRRPRGLAPRGQQRRAGGPERLPPAPARAGWPRHGLAARIGRCGLGTRYQTHRDRHQVPGEDGSVVRAHVDGIAHEALAVPDIAA